VSGDIPAAGDTVRDAGYDDWLDAVNAGEGHYLACPDGHGALPPRRACPDCGSRDLDERPLPATGTVETATTVRVPTPDFADDAPYTTAIADFGPVRLTGVVRGVSGDVDAGLAVVPTVETTATTGDRVLVLRPR
jgi:uncharacterized OB-fold protein